jgi:hypothetical protein
MWVAHLLYHLAIGWEGVWPALERAVTGRVVFFPIPAIPAWLVPVQLLVLDAGLLLTLYVAWRVAVQYASNIRAKLGLMAPWAALACGLYAAGVWILLQPMQMRGMLH